ncbi:benzoate 1,2-dioxygenase subunit beta (plasmid) [Alteromonas mediterranea 615]|uniref:Benzoate 1,2-dioxygenase subunit beta n=1 Tax=Alteromonas mediterranea 615 TaxID=1300253 RepID=S5AIU3_9ALTE|nr:benzoate 1,2-dioxygenase subunit beta [Alteromonas mediterranea 615]
MTYQEIQAFVFREARLLDDRQWDEWLTCYHPKCEYWMPAWDDDDQLTNDPQKEISSFITPIAMVGRQGLPHKTERSGRVCQSREPRISAVI